MGTVEHDLAQREEDLKTDEKTGGLIEALAAEYEEMILKGESISAGVSDSFYNSWDFDSFFDKCLMNNKEFIRALRRQISGDFKAAFEVYEIGQKAVADYALELAEKKIRPGS